MQFMKQEVVRELRRAGLFEDAEWAQASLPETLDFEELARIGATRGITRERLINLLGGSP